MSETINALKKSADGRGTDPAYFSSEGRPLSDKDYKTAGEAAAETSKISETCPASADKLQEINISLEMNPKSMYQGIIFSEILGRPRSRRRGRW